ncbi:MAG: hypothetical protein QW087_07180 [Methanomassiliicoccales archaeon]
MLVEDEVPFSEIAEEFLEFDCISELMPSNQLKKPSAQSAEEDITLVLRIIKWVIRTGISVIACGIGITS